MELKDQRVLVTGATAGIGQETAKLFARRGATVVVTGRNVDRANKTVEAIVAEGGHALFIAADLGDVGSVRQLAEQVGVVDVLVNNAGAFPFASTLEQDVDSFDLMFDVNVRGPFFLTAALLPKMIARGSGVIINVSTAAASASLPDAPVYAATKAALESLTRSWAAAFGGNGIRVNTVARGQPAPMLPSIPLATGWSSWDPRQRWAAPPIRRKSPRRSFSSPHHARATSPARRWPSTAVTGPYKKLDSDQWRGRGGERRGGREGDGRSKGGVRRDQRQYRPSSAAELIARSTRTPSPRPAHCCPVHSRAGFRAEERSTKGTDHHDGHHGRHCAAVVPAMSRTVLNVDVASPQCPFDSVVEFEYNLARQDDLHVHRVRGVHPGIVELIGL